MNEIQWLVGIAMAALTAWAAVPALWNALQSRPR